MRSRRDAEAEVVIDRVEQVGDVVVARRHRVDAAVVVLVRGADEDPPVPGQREDRAVAPGRDDAGGAADVEVVGREQDVGAAAGRDPRDLLLLEDLVRPDPVGPDAGGVDDVGRAHLEALARRPSRAAHPGRLPPLVEDLGHLRPVERDGAEALGLAEDGQDQPRVVGLAVVEEIGGAGLARAEGGDQLRRPPRRRSCGGGPATRTPPRPRARRAGRGRGRPARWTSRRTCSGRSRSCGRVGSRPPRAPGRASGRPGAGRAGP